MDRNTPMGNNGGSSTSTAGAKVQGAARAAHEATDSIADKTAAQIDRLSGSAHRALDSAADAATAATSWASDVADQAVEIQSKAAESASAAIRQKPITILAGALVIGYLIGRL